MARPGVRQGPVRQGRVREVRGLPARRAAADLLTAVLGAGTPLDQAIEASHSGGELGRLADRDRALARLIVATTLRRLPQIEAVLASFLRTPIDARAGTVPAILASAAAQLLFLEIPTHAVVNIATALAGEGRAGRGMKGLVNAVLRRVAAEGLAIVAGQDAAAMVLPKWLEDRWNAAYGGERTRAIAELLLSEPPLDLTIRPGLDASEWAHRLGGTSPVPGTVRLARAGKVSEFDGYGEGAWWVQDAAAALPVRLLGDVGGRRIIDLCAAPGGKTAQLASLGARVTALDRDGARMRRVGENLERLGLAAETVVTDALEWRPAEPADVVLVDAPCSATGVMRRHPDILRRRRPEHVAPLARHQASLLEAAAAMVKSGGSIVYCTCSLEAEEGERQIERLLGEVRGFQRQPIAPEAAAGFASSLTPSGDMRVLPTALAGHGGNDGFYIAIVKKMATNQKLGC